MPSPEVTRKLMAIGLFLLPVGLVKLTELYMGSIGPSQAQAAEADSATQSSQSNSVKAPTWTTRQTDAGKYIATLRTKSFSPTPFLYETREDGSVPAATTSTTDPMPTSTASSEMPKFTLQVILSSSIGKTALIDGKPYHVGDSVQGSSWIIDSIAVENRSVSLKESNSGRTVTIAVELPSLKGQ